ncbi:hypothetical protein CNEO4_640050 [Clostridium neonatale]|nr:hypothetical protein CNEO3_130050 [Clostridium neonatale]CAI3677767.1 hypothetical protein CNEO4_660050 [Clostridium neonatale]CAI3688922.1 hypothetical protein CNEO4_640050 [Clostridium neonatale]CAI3701198.1 hypothetical protein CNEO4_660049 [Clostridium neonatale]CAI4141341.1 hypothetical protein CNEO4_670050 [Clostridium neonatale]
MLVNNFICDSYDFLTIKNVIDTSLRIKFFNRYFILFLEAKRS